MSAKVENDVEKSDYMVEVCVYCLRASCWHDEFPCDDNWYAATVWHRASYLRSLGREHPSRYSREKIRAVCGSVREVLRSPARADTISPSLSASTPGGSLQAVGYIVCRPLDDASSATHHVPVYGIRYGRGEVLLWLDGWKWVPADMLRVWEYPPQR